MKGYGNQQGEHRNNNYFDDPKTCDGWYCYEDDAKLKEPNKKKPEAIYVPGSPSNQPAAQEKRYNGEPIDWKQLWVMHPDDFQEFVTQVQKWSMIEPSPDKAQIYMQVQQIAARRSKEYQQVWAEALNQNPILDDTIRRPPTTLGSRLEVAQKSEDRAAVINSFKDSMGIFLFFKPGCPACQQEEKIMAQFIEEYNWKQFRAIDITKNPKLAMEYNVQVVPDIWIIGNYDGKIRKRRLKAGLASYSDIQMGLLNANSRWANNTPYERPKIHDELITFDEFIKQQDQNSLQSEADGK